MDRSFLSDERVVAAARSFVCIRLSTYESAEEEKILEAIFVGRSGDLENTTFAILSPDGKTKLSRAGRGPHFAYRGPGDMAADMAKIAKKHGAEARSIVALPVESDLRLAINVAGCDGLPLACVVTDQRDAKVEKSLAAVALSKELRGRCVWVRATPTEVATVLGVAEPGVGVLVVAPDEFGVEGKVLARSKGLVSKDVTTALESGLAAFEPLRKRDIRAHVREGRKAGVHWKTKIPVTDPGRPDRHGPPPGPRRGGRAPERPGRDL